MLARMRILHITAALMVLSGSMTPCEAQRLADADGARLGVNLGRGGHGMDLGASIDSPRFGDLAVRAGLNHARWADFENGPTPDDPWVTRLSATLMVVPPLRYPPIRPYGGIGVSRYLVRAPRIPDQRGVHLVGGMETAVGHWTLGPEIQIEFPHEYPDREFARTQLYPSNRFSIAIRRTF